MASTTMWSPSLGLTPVSKSKPSWEVLRGRLRAIKHGDNARVADAARISTATLSRWKKKGAELNPDLATLEGLAEGLGLPLPALLSEEPLVPSQAVTAARERLAEADRLLAEVQGLAATNRKARGIVERGAKAKRRPA